MDSSGSATVVPAAVARADQVTPTVAHVLNADGTPSYTSNAGRNYDRVEPVRESKPAQNCGSSDERGTPSRSVLRYHMPHAGLLDEACEALSRIVVDHRRQGKSGCPQIGDRLRYTAAGSGADSQSLSIRPLGERHRQ